MKSRSDDVRIDSMPQVGEPRYSGETALQGQIAVGGRCCFPSPRRVTLTWVAVGVTGSQLKPPIFLAESLASHF